LENVFEITRSRNEGSKSIANIGRSRGVASRLGPLGKKYVEAVLKGARDEESGIEDVYGVYLHKNGLMLDNKRFVVDDAHNIIIDGVQYAGIDSAFTN